jgi:hypothetical protein
MLKQMMAVVLCASLFGTGCASSSLGRAGTSPVVIDPVTMADYAHRIPAGSRVRIERSAGNVIRGTLLQVGAQSLTIQANARIPEAPFEVPLATITRLTLDDARGGSSTAKAIAIGVASGVGAFLAILGILAATIND